MAGAGRSLLAIACCLPQITAAQKPDLRAWDTVRVWYVQNKDARIGVVEAVSADTVRLRDLRFAVSDVRQIDVARGRTRDRKQFMTLMLGSAAVGAVGWLAFGADCSGCAPLEKFRSGLWIGTGVGLLASTLLPRRPRWHTVWTVPQQVESTLAATPNSVVASAIIADSARRAVESAAPSIGPPATVRDFAMVRPGEWLRVWTGNQVVEGPFREAREPPGLLMLRDRTDSIPFSAIDVFAVRRTYVGQTALLTGGALGMSTAVTMLLLCGITADLGGGCQSSEYVQPVAVATGIGVAVGALIGTARTSWEVRFRR